MGAAAPTANASSPYSNTFGTGEVRRKEGRTNASYEKQDVRYTTFANGARSGQDFERYREQEYKIGLIPDYEFESGQFRYGLRESPRVQRLREDGEQLHSNQHWEDQKLVRGSGPGLNPHLDSGQKRNLDDCGDERRRTPRNSRCKDSLVGSEASQTQSPEEDRQEKETRHHSVADGPCREAKGGTSAGGENTSMMRLVPKTIKFATYNGKGDWDAFIIPLERITKRYQWSEDEKLDQLSTSLRDAAARFAFSLPVDVRENYSLLRETLQERFGQKDPPRMQRIKLSSMRQQSESNETFAEEIMQVTTLAYPGACREAREEYATEAFLKGYKNGELSYDVMNVEPKTLAEALKKINAAENNYKIAFGRQPEPKVSHKTRESDSHEDSCSRAMDPSCEHSDFPLEIKPLVETLMAAFTNLVNHKTKESVMDSRYSTSRSENMKGMFSTTGDRS